MASTLTGRAGARPAPSSSPWSEPELSRLILAGTGVVAFLVVLIWLFVAAMGRAPREPNLLEITLAHPEGVRTEGRPSTKDEIVKQVDAFFHDRTEGPVVVILHGVVASRPAGAAGDQSAYFLTPSISRDFLPTPIPLSDVMKPFTTRGALAPTLLVLDCEVNAGDCSLGYFGNGFMGELQHLLDESRNKSDKLTVLAACDQIQSTWSMEGPHGSVFAYFVKEVLAETLNSRGHISFNELHGQVRSRVARWVDQNRSGAVQTPILAAGTDMTLRSIRSYGVNASSLTDARGDPRQEDEERQEKGPSLEDDLFKEWDQRQFLSKTIPPPYRHAPVAWRLYQEGLLKAERRLRAGDGRSARVILDEARTHLQDVQGHRSGPTIAPAWSLAILQRTDGSAAPASLQETDAAINRLLGPEAAPKRLFGTAGARSDSPAKPEPAKDLPAGAKAEPVAPSSPIGPDPLAVLAVDGNPKYVEGQLPLWYLEFERKGGETHELRPERLRLLRKAVDIRKKAEQIVAVDTRVIPWVRPLVVQADKERRAAQDYCFAGDLASFRHGDQMLARALVSYDKAAAETESCFQALELLETVQNALPYYGATFVYSGERATFLDDVITQTTALADLVYQNSASESGLDDRRKALLAAAARLKSSFKQLEDDFQGRLRQSETAEWRQIDALLRFPAIDPKKRQSLLARARALSPAATGDVQSVSVDSRGGSYPDKTFTDLAIGLATLEHGLLKIAGRDVSRLGDWIGAAVGEDRSKLTAADFDKISDRARRLREQAVSESLAALNVDAQLRDQALKDADRFARICTGVELAQLARSGDPARSLDEIDSRHVTLWNARRLLEDFDIAAARRLAAGPGLFRSQGRKDVDIDAADLDANKLIVKTESSNPGVTRTKVSLGSQGKFPDDGRAVVFFARAPETAEIAPPQMTTIARPDPLEFTLRNHGEKALNLTPTAFFRGRFYQEREFPLPVSELVKVEIHQKQLRDIKVKVPDQFAKQQRVGYFHIDRNLEYWLDFTNKADKALTAYISSELGGLKSPGNRVLETGVPERIEGRVIAGDKPQTLTVSVTENDEHGPSLCTPLKIQFIPIDPANQVSVDATFDGEYYRFVILHRPDDPAPFPVDVKFSVEPHQSFRQDNNVKGRYVIPKGHSITLNYEMTDPVDLVTHRITVNSRPEQRGLARAREKKKEEDKAGDAEKNPKPPGPVNE